MSFGQRMESAKPYLTGFVLAMVLTIVPFAITAAGGLSRGWFDLSVGLAAVIQVLVHMRYFLHLDLRHTPRENLLALGFTGVLIFLMIGGTLWIMSNLAARMMAM